MTLQNPETLLGGGGDVGGGEVGGPVGGWVTGSSSSSSSSFEELASTSSIKDKE